MGGSMWEPDQFTPPLGGEGAERTSGTVEKLILSPAENGAESAPAPTALTAEVDQRLRDAVYALRLQQPDEFSVYARMAQIEKELADVKAIVDMQTEVILRLRGAA